MFIDTLIVFKFLVFFFLELFLEKRKYRGASYWISPGGGDDPGNSWRILDFLPSLVSFTTKRETSEGVH